MRNISNDAPDGLSQACDPVTAFMVLLRWWIAYKVFLAFFRRSPQTKMEVRKSAHKIPATPTTSLSDVVGLESVKSDIKQYVDFIASPQKYREWGVSLPKGVLLAGPPGTGKTMLVRAMASELGVPVETACGSEFVEMYVGVGASRIRALFERAKSHDACIVFIDEVDAIGGKRGGDHNSERDSTLNQLLVEMDGFEGGEGIMVFAATNLCRTLDPALLRSGRFDRKVYFDAPNLAERKEMWARHLSGFTLERGNGPDALARDSAGLTGADVANVCNLAKLNALREGISRAKLSRVHIRSAMDEVMVGREKSERTMSSQELERVAHHEAGHALVAHMLPHCEPPIKVSVVPRGESALGFSQQAAEDTRLYTRSAILARIAVLLAGRAAELLIYGDVSTGAADDIERATRLVHRYVGEWGMDKETGPVNTDIIDEATSKRCTSIIEHLAAAALDLLKPNEIVVRAMASRLVQEGTLDRQALADALPASLKNAARPISAF